MKGIFDFLQEGCIMPFKEKLKRLIGVRAWVLIRQKALKQPVFHPSFDENECVFIHVPKAAGTSIGKALFETGRTGHYEWYIYNAVDAEKFKKYFKFSFVRNPFDRVVSPYFYLSQGGKNDRDRRFFEENLSGYAGFDDFILRGLGTPIIDSWGHFKPQSDFLVDKTNGELKVDFLGYFESIDDDFETLRNRLGGRELEKVNVSERSGFRNYYTNPEVVKKVLKVYADDFKYFGYEKDIDSMR